MSTLSNLLNQGYKSKVSSTSGISTSSTLSRVVAGKYATPEEKNKGGFFGGLGYTLGKLGTGAFSILEGIWDFTAGGIADLFGADEWAEEQFANNIAGDWSQSLDEWYNPSKGWQVAGDVASGIGNSLVGIGVAVGASLITGGMAPLAVYSWLAAGTMGLGAAGNATSEAYAKTGKLGGKEYLYGALTGASEMVLEKVSGGIESTLAKTFAKDTAKTITKKTIVKGLVKNFASEAFEEGVSEFITPYYQRWTQVDPNAENATAKQIGYAALVGGLSGMLMGGVGDSISAVKDMSRGNKISQNPQQVESIVEMAREYAEHEAEHSTGNEKMQYLYQLVSDYDARDKGTGELTLTQKKLLARMERANIAMTYEPMVENSRQQIIANADAFVEAINARNYPDGKGGVLHFDSGADFVANEAMLTTFAVQDALGKLLLSADSVYDLAMNRRGEGMLQADFRNFQKNATAESKAGIREVFGVDVDSTTYEDFMERLSTTNQSVLEGKKAGMYARATSKKLISNAVNTGAEISTFSRSANIPDGTTVYKTKDGKLFTITKTADGYYLYFDGNISVKLTKKQLLQAIRELNGVKPKATKKPTTTQTAAPAPVAPAETVVEQQTENAEPVAAAQTEENAPVAEEVVAADNTPAETTTQTEERAEAPVDREQAADKEAKRKKKIKEMIEAEDNIPANVIGHLIENGTLDYDEIMRENRTADEQTGVEAFAISESDYVRQGCFTAKSLADAITEYAKEINADYKDGGLSLEMKVKVWDKAFSIEGKAQPAWYVEQYHEKATQTGENTADNGNGQAEPQTRKKTAKKKPATVSNTESVAKTKAPTKATARRGVVKLAMRKDVRANLKGAAIKDGNQYVSDGYFAARYTDILEGVIEVPAENYPVEAFNGIINENANATAEERVEIDADKIRGLVPTKRADYIQTIMKVGKNYYQVAYFSKILDSISNAQVFVKKKGEYNPVYFKGDNGEAVLLPIRVNGGEVKPVYKADYAGQESTRTTTPKTGTTTTKKKTTAKKTAPKTQKTETATVKPEKTISGKTYKDFTAEEFNALIPALRGYYLAKNKKPSAIVAAQLGNFYEVFFDDAKTVANELDLTLTGRAFNGYTDRVPMVGFPVAKFAEYKSKLNAKGLDVVKVDSDGKKVLYSAKTDGTTTETQEKSQKKKMDDFGEKIGGARKDEWRKSGLRTSHIQNMNQREVEKYVKKENVWKRPNWVDAVAAGSDRGLLYAQNEIYKSLNATPYIPARSRATEAQIKQAAQTYAEEIAEIKAMAEKAQNADDINDMGVRWLAEKGYIEVSKAGGGVGFSYTQKYYESPALAGGDYMHTVHKLAKHFETLGDKALMDGFGVAAEDRLPRGYEIKEAKDWQGRSNGFYITKGRYVVARGFKSFAEALAAGKEKFGTAANAKTEATGKMRFIPPQLEDIHRQGLDYRQGKDATGDDFLRDFGIKGGEFGNWLSETDRTESLNYGYDAFCDLADALDMEMLDISLQGTLSIGFGSRGHGLTGAVAHYEPERKVINLTKMKGAGSLAHEWWHAFEDYIAGDTHQSTMSSDFSKIPTKTRAAAVNLVNVMNYTEPTVEEKMLAKQKRREQTVRRAESAFRTLFRPFESDLSDTTQKSYAEKYYKKVPTAEDISKYNELKATALKGVEDVYTKHIAGERTIVDDLNDILKEITGKGLQKEDRRTLAVYIDELSRDREVQLRKHTQYHDDAIAIGKQYNKDGGYWDSNCEMLARAFAAYITDKTNKGNDYLSGHSEGAAPVRGSDGNARVAYIMPRGAERVAINAAFDELFAAAKEEGVIASATRVKPTAKHNYAVSETADLNAQPAGNKSQNLPPLQMKRAESYARQKVKGYDDLSAAQKLEVEWTIASGWRNGVEESQILTLARLSAQAKIGIGFADLTATDKNGNSVSIDAACYSRGGHLTVYLNPKSKRTVEVATLHELTHAMEGMEGYAELQAMAEEYYKAHPEEKAKIDGIYRNLYKNEQVRYAEEILPAELTAHYIETMLENRGVLAKITAEQPTFMERCIKWLKKRVSFLRKTDAVAADEADILARKFVSTFNINKGKIVGNGANTRYAAGREIKKYNPTTEEVARNTETVSKMKTVAVLKGDEFRLEGGAIVKAVAAYYNSLGNSVYSNELGDVELTKRGVKDSFAHGIGERKAAAYHAVPEIIKSGKVVDYQQNWKGRGYDTAIIAAPISIYGEEYYAAVVVRRTQSTQRFYLHEIDIEKRSAVLTEATAANSTQELGGSPFINSIFQKIRNVNTFSQNSTGNFDKGTKKRYALSPEAQTAAENVVTTELPTDRVSFKDVMTRKKPIGALTEQIKGDSRNFTEGWRIATTNAQAGLERVLTEVGESDATAITNYVRAGKNGAFGALTVGQFSLDGSTYLGESWQKIWASVYAMDKRDGKAYAKFQEYLLHWHNVDRMAVGKPVFGEIVTATDSQAAIAEIEAQYPKFKKIAEKVWKFNDNNLQMAVEGGLYSQEYAENLRSMYPHYVPTQRVEHQKGLAVIQGKGNLRVNPNKRKATGADTQILPIDDVVAQQTIQRISAARINQMLLKLANGAEHSEFAIIGGESVDADIDADTLITTHQDKAKGQYQITFWKDGKSITAEVSQNVYKGIEAFMPSGDAVFNNAIMNFVAGANTLFKKLVTAWNPFFVFYKNPLRDIQTALNYTRYSWATYTKNLKRAKGEISNNGRYWQEAQAAGILSASVYDYRKGLQYKNQGKFSRIMGKLESASNAIEMAPRLAEYISAREAGLSVQEALLQAQDLTTNFGRSGTLTKKANATFMPFLNPAVQGFSKMVRAYTGKDAAKSWVNLIIRSLILGVGLTALNDLLNGDDEEYQNLSDYVKENNYVLALGGGDFLKIPKGRENGFIGQLYLRAKRAASGDENAWEGTLDSFISNLTPTDNFTRTIFSPLVDAQTNTTWYGGTIEGQKWDDTEPKNRYDESTSRISIWLGKVFNYSPIKIDYLLEQYGGVVADIVLPATSTQAESGIITQNLLTNSTTNSKWSTEFYNAIEEYTYKKTAGDSQAKGVVKYLNSVNSTISDLYQQKRTIQADKSIADSEKLTQVKVVQATINALEKEALTNAKLLYEELGKYDLTEDNFDTAYLYGIATVVGEEYALKSYNKSVYEKSQKLNNMGINYATYFDYYFSVKFLKDNKAKKDEIVAYTMQQDLPTVQKYILILSAGYTIADGDISNVSGKQAKTAVAKYISKLDLSKEEKTELAEMCGLTVKNGKIYIS